jgi:hypothetical protein
VDFCLGSSVYIVTNEPASKGLRSKHTVVKEIADKFNISSEEVTSYAKILFRSCLRNVDRFSCFLVNVSLVYDEGVHHFDSTQRTQSGNKHGKAVRATQLWYVIIYG